MGHLFLHTTPMYLQNICTESYYITRSFHIELLMYLYIVGINLKVSTSYYWCVKTFLLTLEFTGLWCSLNCLYILLALKAGAV